MSVLREKTQEILQVTNAAIRVHLRRWLRVHGFPEEREHMAQDELFAFINAKDRDELIAYVETYGGDSAAIIAEARECAVQVLYGERRK